MKLEDPLNSYRGKGKILIYYQYQVPGESYRAKNPTLQSYRSDRGKGPTQKCFHGLLFRICAPFLYYDGCPTTGTMLLLGGTTPLLVETYLLTDPERVVRLFSSGLSIPASVNDKGRGLVFSSRFIWSQSYSSLLADHYVYCLLCSLWKSRLHGIRLPKMLTQGRGYATTGLLLLRELIGGARRAE